MNITRILGQNNKIYQKFGDYCITETEPNQCSIICCFCQEEHHSENAFWAHVQQLHAYAPARLCIMRDTPTLTSCEGDSDSHDNSPIGNDCESTLTTAKTTALQPVANDAPMYVEAEYLESVVLNDPNTLLELTGISNTFLDFQEQKPNGTKGAIETGSQEKENVQQAERNLSNKEDKSPHLKGIRKIIDIDKLTPKQLLEDGVLLKSLFQQMQRASNEFKYKLNKLTQAVQLIESELKKEPGSRTLKRYMKIIPDQPFTSRDEVLILDDELHHSKEMRDALHEETIALAAENADVFCRILWRFIMTDEVSNQFCWRGVVNADKVIKYPIKDMTMMDVFQGVFREKFPGQTLHFFKDRTMTYFNKAHERLKRKQLNKADVNGAESNGCDLVCTKVLSKAQESDYKRARSDADKIEDGVDSVFEEVFCE
ncbi:uncharacterized protein LOC118748803 [Rhagoletis pomonella]|uniref:uncharacterized protein LOC118748803 n=1 Tax=Rhagoletis pomonella TaxID=28610 RepID=UPI001787355F|nr:uncharacterized protein LOC118748803 [Rhagoletis pomonella]